MSVPPLRSLLHAVILALVLGMPGAVASAQSCHAPSLRESDGIGLRAGVGGVFASYDNQRGRGEYQGVHARAAFSQRWFFVEAALPYYRLVRNGATAQGIGDVAADVRLYALHWDELGLLVGPEFAVTLPTGDAHHDLGMGHTMLMPGLFMSLSRTRVTLVAQLAYGVALGSDAHPHHGGQTPIVGPMNNAEIEHGFGIAYSVHDLVRVTGRVLGAVPVGASHGLGREVVAAGLQLVLGPVDISVEQHLPVVGQPFQSKTVLSLGGQW